MLKGFKHAVKCSKCNEMVYDSDGDVAEALAKKSSDCCDAKQDYVGLQPYVDKVLVFAKPVLASEQPVVNESMVSFVEGTAAVQSETIVQPTVQTVTNLKIVTDVPVGKRGKMTTVMMRNLVRGLADQGKYEEILPLKQEYPVEYGDCLRYLPAKVQKNLL